MGISSSKSSNDEERGNSDYDAVKKSIKDKGDDLKFSEEQFHTLKTIYDKYKDEFRSTGKIDPSEFITDFDMAPRTGQKIYDFIFPKESNAFIDLNTFVYKLNCLHPEREYSKACETVFNLYKEGENITFDGIKEIVSCSLDSSELMSLPGPKLEVLVDQLIKEFNEDGDDQIQLEEFRELVYNAHGIIGSLQLNLDAIFKN